MRTGSLIGAMFILANAGIIGSGARAVAEPPADAKGVATVPDVASQLAAIEKAIDGGRQALHIPGASLVIVQDDKVIYLKGFGLRDLANKLPVTPDTQFAIGSSTKAFTAMTAMMSVDDGKLALSDPPRKFLPYFKLRDPEADSKITISDLLCHRSGLDRTDIAWYTNKLNAEETIRLVGQIKPTAKFGEKFQYQNVMFLTAGQCVGVAQKAPWRSVVAKRIFKPLGMKATNTTIRDLLRSNDHAFGYTYDPATKENILVPYHDLPAIAPAGAINSNAREMARWVRLMLGGGVFEGTRLVSETNFAELFKKRITVGGGADYGYGWFLRDWNGHKVVEHGGNIDGFNAQVALMPDQKLGFVLLTNVSSSPLGVIAMETIWDKLVGAPKVETAAVAATTGEKVAPEREAGTYRLTEANVEIVVAFKDGKLTAHSARLPETPLENVSGRRYKFALPGIDVFATFRPTKDNPQETELFFEQPGAKLVGKRVTASEDLKLKPALNAFVPPLTVDALMEKVVEAQGGEANLRRHKTFMMKAIATVETQGLNLEIVVYARAPNAQTSLQTMYAGKKRIGVIRSYFDGKDGGSESSFSAASKLSGDSLTDMAIGSAFCPELNWKSMFKTVAITGKDKVGDEEVYAVEMRPEKGNTMTDYVSVKTFRVLRRKLGPGSQAETFSDFRTVDRVLVPFRRTAVGSGLGETVTTVTAAKFDTKIPESLFQPAKQPAKEENP
jgi:CubicO group peptidase (beta-lactamase class C family)